MTLYLSQFFTLFIYFFICFLLSFIFFILSYVLGPKKIYIEKLSAYECGFDPFDNARNTFDIRFYLVAILFIVFDLEVSFLFPWCIIISKSCIFSYWSLVVFLIILTIGFIYEWKKGALVWE